MEATYIIVKRQIKHIKQLDLKQIQSMTQKKIQFVPETMNNEEDPQSGAFDIRGSTNRFLRLKWKWHWLKIG